MRSAIFRIVLLTGVFVPLPGAGQDVDVQAIGGEVAGRVIESGSRTAISGALIILTPDPVGVFVSSDAGEQTSAPKPRIGSDSTLSGYF